VESVAGSIVRPSDRVGGGRKSPALARRPLRPVDRLVAAFLVVLMAAGSLALWVVVPAGSLWALTQLSESKTFHLFVGIFGVPLAMILFAPILFWLNALYLRVTGQWAYDEEEDQPRRLRGPLEPILLWSLLIAFAALCFWFFVLAENPSSQVL
jgi:hypothetical protein